MASPDESTPQPASSEPAGAEHPTLRHPAVERFRAALSSALGESAPEREITVLDAAARTAAQAAEQLGVTPAAIANSLIFAAETVDGEQIPLLVLTSGGHRVDTGHVAEQAGLARLGRADADFVREHTGFVIGGVAPVGHLTSIRTYVDRTLADHDPIWAAAGHAHAVFPTTYDELLRVTGGTPISVAPDA